MAKRQGRTEIVTQESKIEITFDQKSTHFTFCSSCNLYQQNPLNLYKNYDMFSNTNSQYKFEIMAKNGKNDDNKITSSMLINVHIKPY